MQLDGREAQVLGDVAVLDRGRVVERAPLHPLGGHGRARDRRAAPKRLEARVGDRARGRVDADLQLHDVAAGGRADEARADVGVLLVEGADVARALVVVDDLRFRFVGWVFLFSWP